MASGVTVAQDIVNWTPALQTAVTTVDSTAALLAPADAPMGFLVRVDVMSLHSLLGATWAGGSDGPAPAPLDAAILFARSAHWFPPRCARREKAVASSAPGST